MGLGDTHAHVCVARSMRRHALRIGQIAIVWSPILNMVLCYVDHDFTRARRYAAAQLQLATIAAALESSQAMALTAMGDVAPSSG